MQPKESKSDNHFFFSLWKSGLRITACFFLAKGDYLVSAILLVLAEAFGIMEEIL